MKNWTLEIFFMVALVASGTFLHATDSSLKYDQSSEARITGTIVAVKDYTCPLSGTLGAHLTVKPDQGPPVEVHLAAPKFTKRYDMSFSKGERVEVVGSKLKFQGSDAIMAREVSRGTDTFTFRDQNGKPLW
jgi:hypothetical protein